MSAGGRLRHPRAAVAEDHVVHAAFRRRVRQDAFLLLHVGQERSNRIAQARKLRIHDLPDDLEIDSVIPVDEAVPRSGDLRSRYARRLTVPMRVFDRVLWQFSRVHQP